MRAAALGVVLLCGIAQGAEPNTIGMKLIEIPAGNFNIGRAKTVSCESPPEPDSQDG